MFRLLALWYTAQQFVTQEVIWLACKEKKGRNWEWGNGQRTPWREGWMELPSHGVRRKKGQTRNNFRITEKLKDTGKLNVSWWHRKNGATNVKDHRRRTEGQKQTGWDDKRTSHFVTGIKYVARKDWDERKSDEKSRQKIGKKMRNKELD